MSPDFFENGQIVGSLDDSQEIGEEEEVHPQPLEIPRPMPWTASTDNVMAFQGRNV